MVEIHRAGRKTTAAVRAGRVSKAIEHPRLISPSAALPLEAM